MPRPPRRKRCSFGGKEGVWWRHKSSEETYTTSASTPEPTSFPVSDGPLVVKDTIDLKVEWDDMLARPIYHHSTRANQVVSSDDERSDPSTREQPKPKRTKASFFQTRLPVRRIKTFGGRSRRPLSLLLSDGYATPLSASDDSDCSHRTPGQDRSNAPTDQQPGPIVRTLKSSPSNSENPPQVASPYDFKIDASSTAGNGTRTTASSSTPLRPTATSSIRQAQDYFAHLDASCQLQLDASASPSRKRPSLVRTSRKIQLSSPGFRLEYSQYANAIRELGVSPLAPDDYAKTRRALFRKNELFDGFVDS
jgi:hypothetical protein